MGKFHSVDEKRLFRHKPNILDLSHLNSLARSMPLSGVNITRI